MRPLPLLLLATASLAMLALSLLSGSVALETGEAWRALSGSGEPLHTTLLLELRLPRALAAFGVGGLLAIAGALMQVQLGNPLADPYVLGISGGAAVGALLCLLLGFSGLLVNGGALLGALASTLLVFGLARGPEPRAAPGQATRLLLTGVVTAAGWGALVGLLLAIAPSERLHGMLFWLMGDLSGVRLAWPALALLGLALLLSLPLARSLNLLARGELQAAALGVSVRPLRYAIFFIASLLTAGAVSIGGSIGFVGLVVPHLLRLWLGSDHRLLLPAAALGGGLLLLAADTLARTLIAPQQLPVGVLTALIGVPLFLYLLRREVGR